MFSYVLTKYFGASKKTPNFLMSLLLVGIERTVDEKLEVLGLNIGFYLYWLKPKQDLSL